MGSSAHMNFSSAASVFTGTGGRGLVSDGFFDLGDFGVSAGLEGSASAYLDASMAEDATALRYDYLE